MLSATFLSATQCSKAKEDAMMREAALILIIEYLMHWDPREVAGVRLDDVFLSATQKTAHELIITFMIHHNAMTSRTCQRLVSPVDHLARHDRWPIGQMAHDIGGHDLPLLLINHKLDIMHQDHMMGLADAMAEVLSQHPKQYNYTPLQVMQKILYKANNYFNFYHSNPQASKVALRVIDHLFIAGRWDGFWQSVAACDQALWHCYPYGNTVQDLLDEARKRNVGLPGSPLCFPSSLKPMAES